jgi:formylglycine-generating enzyme required for sulfatase activity
MFLRIRLKSVAFCAAWIGSVLSGLLVNIASAHAEKRVALVVGNDSYLNLAVDRQLLNAAHDAQAVGDALAKIGFTVVRGANLGRQGMIDKLAELTSQLQPGDTAAFFYAGHGVAIGGVNYLVPSDVPAVTPDAEARVRGASIAEADVVAELEAKGVRVALLVLDACRDNPFPRTATRSIGSTRGLVDAKPARGVFTIYSAGIGQTALDRLGPNDPTQDSVFTRVFVDELAKPGIDLTSLAVETRERVAQLASQAKDSAGQPEPHEQTPAYYDQTVGGRIYLAGFSAVVAQPRVASPNPCDGHTIAVSLYSRPTCPLSTEEERALKPKDTFKECVDCAEMVVVPAGKFAMGGPSTVEEERELVKSSPQHDVKFETAFAVGRFAVTFDEWDACVSDNACRNYKPAGNGPGRGRHPVVNVSWVDAKRYAAWLSRKTGKPYHLITEAEREYVARAGTRTPFWWGASMQSGMANYGDSFHLNAKPDGSYQKDTLIVDSLQPNPWGLYHVHGNVREWTEDCYHKEYNGAPSDGSAWLTAGDCGRHMTRGGSYMDPDSWVEADSRLFEPTCYMARDTGFRVARSLFNGTDSGNSLGEQLETQCHAEEQEQKRVADLMPTCDSLKSSARSSLTMAASDALSINGSQAALVKLKNEILSACPKQIEVFAGTIATIIPCYNKAMYVKLADGKAFVFTEETETFSYGRPQRTGELMMGITDEASFCLKSMGPPDGLVVLPALHISAMARRQ